MSKRRARGVLHLVYPGVYSLGHTELSREGQWLAAVFSGGEGAVLSHLSAAALWRLLRYVPRLHDVLVRRRHRPVDGIQFRKCLHLDPLDATKYHGIPVTTVARTLVDLTDSLTVEELANVIHEAAFHNRFSVAATRAAMERANGRRNLARLEAAIAAHLAGSAGTKSGGEVAFLRLVERAALPKPLVNTELLGFEVDFHWPGEKLVAEVDGPGHARPRTRAEDEARDEILRAAGYAVVRGRPEDLIAKLLHPNSEQNVRRRRTDRKGEP